MWSEVRNFAAHPMHKFGHSAVIVIMTHGGPDGRLVGTDGLCLYLREIVSCFNRDNCPALAGKPKIFIIVACRGGQSYNIIFIIILPTRKYLVLNLKMAKGYIVRNKCKRIL